MLIVLRFHGSFFFFIQRICVIAQTHLSYVAFSSGHRDEIRPVFILLDQHLEEVEHLSWLPIAERARNDRHPVQEMRWVLYLLFSLLDCVFVVFYHGFVFDTSDLAYAVLPQEQCRY